MVSKLENNYIKMDAMIYKINKW